jgi:hypothetical protein
MGDGNPTGGRNRGASPQGRDLDSLSDQPTSQSPTMSDLEDYLGRVRGLLISLANRLTPGEQKEVEHLIDHGEPAEAMRDLAWLIVEENKMVPAATIVALRALTSGLIEEKDMPTDLENHIES